jgi:predicted short-subunit dehydrogenase-like oxidoreductase (DUF2520 family)
MDMQSVSIIGVGRIGGALAIALSRAGYTIDQLVYRSDATLNRVLPLLSSGVRCTRSSQALPTIESDIVLITTADPGIEPVADELAGTMTPGRVVLHASGSLSSEILSSLTNAAHFTGSMHPLVSISDAVSGADNFDGAFFCIEGHGHAVAAGRSLAESIGGRTFSIATDSKALYHAAAVTAAGHVVALIDVAIEMLSKCGIENDQARDLLGPLVESTIGNLRSVPPNKALTGSYARLDAAAVDRHIDAIRSSMSRQILDLYLLLGERSLDIAASNGADSDKVNAVRDLISIAKRKAG